MTVGSQLMLNLVSIDIGCGMTLAQIKARKIKVHRFADEFDFTTLHCYNHIRTNKALLILGTLGGGNHFIEADKDDEGNLSGRLYLRIMSA